MTPTSTLKRRSIRQHMTPWYPLKQETSQLEVRRSHCTFSTDDQQRYNSLNWSKGEADLSVNEYGNNLTPGQRI